jgi:chemotaxis protein MotB
MFDIGSSHLKGYTNTILREVAKYLKTVPNHVSITGHTDTSPYAGVSGYTNWDLSTDRANAARRALEGAGYDTSQISRVTGLSSSVLFDKQNPRNPVNRRISIVVMTQAAEERAQRIDIPSAASFQMPGLQSGADVADPADAEAPLPNIVLPPVASATPPPAGASPGAH